MPGEQKMALKQRLTELFYSYMASVSSPEETLEFLRLASDPVHVQLLKDLMDDYLKQETFTKGMDELQQRIILDRILQQAPSKGNVYPLWKRVLAAAVVVLTLSLPVYLYLSSPPKKDNLYTTYHGEILPGSRKAILMLSNGRKISLTDVLPGEVANQEGVKISKSAEGKLIYQEMKQEASGATQVYNTIIVPPGGNYQVVLPDGTKVWLNAASSLHYPVSFSGSDQRRVQLSGEAYFEVAKVRSGGHRMPFIVSGGAQELKVLGTHFNISAYPGESTTTTLLEGSVALSRDGVFEQVLKPGQQAKVNSGIQVQVVDTSAAVAWKNGLFKFEDAGIHTVMKQFSRWYDVDVQYQGEIPGIRFTGEVYRNMPAAKALQLLSLSHIKFAVLSAPGGRKQIIISGINQP
jgi:transmembrane sensor